MKRKIIRIAMGLLLIGLSPVNAATNYCNHVLFPIQPKAVWSYNRVLGDAEYEAYTLTVQSVFTKGETTTASVNFFSNGLGGISYPLLFECSPSNGITLVQLNNIVIPLPNGKVVKLTLNDQSGMILPPMDQLQIGSTWPFVIDFKGSYTAKETGKAIAVGVRVEVNAELTEILKGVEVPAGEFQNVYEIQQDVSIQVTIAKMKKPIRTLNSLRTWYLAEGVGPVSADFLNMVTDLISYSLPVVATEQGVVDEIGSDS